MECKNKMEKRRKGELRMMRKVSHICFLLLALLQIITPSSAQNTSPTVSTTTTTSPTVSTTTTTPTVSSTTTTSPTVSTTTTTSTVSSTTTTPTVSSTTTTPTVSSTTPTVTTSAPDPAALSYRTRPADATVALGESVVFSCGVPEASPSLTFTFYGSQGNYSLICPSGHVEDTPQALSGSCELEDGESLAVWSLWGTSIFDNGTRVVCQQSNNPDTLKAVLHVYDNGTSYAILIGCTIGGFFGILLVFALSYTFMWRSARFQKCFRGNEMEDDMISMVTKDKKRRES